MADPLTPLEQMIRRAGEIGLIQSSNATRILNVLWSTSQGQPRLSNELPVEIARLAYERHGRDLARRNGMGTAHLADLKLVLAYFGVLREVLECERTPVGCKHEAAEAYIMTVPHGDRDLVVHRCRHCNVIFAEGPPKEDSCPTS